MERTSALLDSLREGAADGAAVEALAFLGDHVAAHFEAEERLMQSLRYPSLQAHQEEHREFRRRVGELGHLFVIGGPGPELSEVVRQSLCDWIVRHVSGSDAAIGRHLRAVEAGAAPGEPSG